MTEYSMRATTKFANPEKTKFHPVIMIGGWEYVFPLTYNSEDEAAAKANSILVADINNMQKDLIERSGIWLQRINYEVTK